MEKRDKLIEDIYIQYSSLEKDISKLKKSIINNSDIVELITEIIEDEGLTNIFNETSEKLGIDNTFEIYDKIIKKYDIYIDDDNIESICDNDIYEEYLNKKMKKKRFSNTLLKRVIEMRKLFFEDTEIEEIKKEDYEKLTDDILRDYLIEISKFKVLTKEEEKDLFERYKNGDLSAKEKIINHNLKLVVSNAYKIKPKELKMSMMDFIQEGNIGLMKAVDKFDSTKGFKFSTYATWWIRQALGRSVDDKDSIIRLPVHLNEKIRKYRYARTKFILENNRVPTDEELMKILGYKEKTYQNLKNCISILNVDSIDRTVENDGKKDRETSVGNLIADTGESVEEIVERGILHDYEEEIMRKILTPKEAIVIKERFGFEDQEEKTLEAIGRKLGVTRERIRQIEVKAKKKLDNYGIREKEKYDTIKKVKEKNTIIIKKEPKKEIKKENTKLEEVDSMSKKPIYELVDGEKELIDNIIQNDLTEEDRNLIKRRETEKLNKEENGKFFMIVSKIKTRLKNKDINRTPTRAIKRRTIYEIVEEDKELVDSIIANELTEEEKDLIRRRETENLSKKDRDRFYGTLIPKIRNKIKRHQTQPVTPKKEEPNEVVEIKEESKETKPNNSFEQNYKELLSIIINDPIVIKEIDIMDIAITCVRYGIGKSKAPRDVDTISKFFSIPKEEVEEICINTLKKLYNVLLSKISGSEDDIKKLIKQNEDNN